MYVSVYIVDLETLSYNSKVQDYGNTKIALRKATHLLSSLGGDLMFLENIRWSRFGIYQDSILAYDPTFKWGLVLTNSKARENKMGPFDISKLGSD